MKFPSWLRDIPPALWEYMRHHTDGFSTTTCDEHGHWRTFTHLLGEYAGLAIVRHNWKEGVYEFDAIELFAVSPTDDLQRVVRAKPFIWRAIVRKSEKEWPGIYGFENPPGVTLFPTLRTHLEEEVDRMVTDLKLGPTPQTAA